MVDDGIGAAYRSIEREDVSDDGSGLAAIIGKPCDPFHDREVVVDQALDFDVQPGRGVIAFEDCLGDVGVNPMPR